MKLEYTKGALKRLEAPGQPGMDRVLSLMSALIEDIYEETGEGIHCLQMVSKAGNEDGFINALYNVSLELADIMDDIDAEKMPEELQLRTKRVLNEKESVQKLAETTKQWKTLEEEQQKLKQELTAAEQKLEEQKAKISELQKQKMDLELELADANTTEEACEAEISRLEKEISELPQTQELTEIHKRVLGQRKRFQMVNDYISGYLEDFSEDIRLAQKFELSEEKCQNDLKNVDAILKNLEQHYGKMLQFMELHRIEKENRYAGN